MLKPQLLLQKPFFSFHGNTVVLLPFQLPWNKSASYTLQRTNKIGVDDVGANCSGTANAITSNVKATLKTQNIEKSVTVTAKVTVKLPTGGLLSNIGVNPILDGVVDLVGKGIQLELVSSELDPKTGEEKKTIQGYAHKLSEEEKEATYEAKFEVPVSFGEIGAVLVENEHQREMYVATIVLDGLTPEPDVPAFTIICNSWVASKFHNAQKRVFFTKPYLPWKTPSGLKRLREKELEELRGNGMGERKKYDRIYDYDKYNDLGDPDISDDLARPVLGGSEHPYPRRGRTGRPPAKKDPFSESRNSSNFYVPKDEAFSGVKQLQFSAKTLRSVLHALVPSLSSVIDPKKGFRHFTAIDSLFDQGSHYDQGIALPKHENKGFFSTLLPRMIKAIRGDDILLFETPEMMKRDKFSWLRDEEFSRQALAGVNPYSIQLVTEWPMKSKLDPKIYGPPESAITNEIIEREIKGIMSIEKALEEKKLFVIDYHDLLLPYVNKIREIEGATMYGSRTLFFLMDDSTLRPVAIELTRPPNGDKPQWKKVYTPGWDATTCWLWKFAKVNVCAHDSGYHELVSHWLRTHACTEPYVIATNRQLSAMHPIYRLLHPHLRYTMEINALAREALINANGVIERAFSPSKYSMELSSAAYNKLWRFDMEGLPADLIRRGMAVEDPKAKHGLKLTIQDYPFAADGLLIWDAIKSWVSDYVNHYYPESGFIAIDEELHAWWNEIRTRGHEDKKDEPWWPVLKTQEDLIQILTTMIWVASAHHAAVNFGQYAYGGYFPNRPTIARTNMPDEDTTEEEYFINFLRKPEAALLQCFPSKFQAASVMAVLDVLSSHSPDEEYLGDLAPSTWGANPSIKAAYERFSGKMRVIEGIIDSRNCEIRLKNRSGAGVVPYELMKPFSKPGVTGMGIPNSISI